MGKALVKNAAHEYQVEKASQREKRIREEELKDLRFIMKAPEGQRFLARLLAHCRLNSSVWHPSAAIHRYAGHQEIGQFIYGEMIQADKLTAINLVANEIEKELKGEEDV
jgi:hypothetical protein